MDINVEAIKQLISCLDQSSVDALRLETEDFKLCLKKEKAPVITASPTVLQQTVPAPAQPAPVQVEAQPVKPEPAGKVIKAPIVGTFYRKPSPDKPLFCEVGQKVKKGDVLFIIESMKLMNEITSEFDGTVAEIFVENGKSVEFGQPVMRIE